MLTALLNKIFLEIIFYFNTAYAFLTACCRLYLIVRDNSIPVVIFSFVLIHKIVVSGIREIYIYTSKVSRCLQIVRKLLHCDYNILNIDLHYHYHLKCTIPFPNYKVKFSTHQLDQTVVVS